MSRSPRPFCALAGASRVFGRWATLSLLGLLACAHTDQVESRVVALRVLTQRAREQGAYRCAPEELARSEAHLEFAQRELDQGNPVRAREHLVLVSANAKAALRLSSDAGCTAASPSAPEARHHVGRRGALTKNTAQRTKRRGSTKEHAAI
jgi:hypothetical protein